MLFSILKAYARLSILVFCRKIIINQPAWLKADGPLLLACNHPNSFLDGIILTILFKKNVYSLARGDAFKKPTYQKLLRWLHLLPVYRTSEGVENLEHNYTTFDECRQVFKETGIVIIFSEGRCINEWHLRPLKKGTARLAISSWQSGINLTVLPVGFNYNGFKIFGKNVFLNFGQPLTRADVLSQSSEGKMFANFNQQLSAQLEQLVWEIDKADKPRQTKLLTVPVSLPKKILLALPAVAGFVLHLPLYYPAKRLTFRYFNNDHFDSSLTGILTLVYPFYLLLFAVAATIFFSWQMALVTLVALPVSAWCTVQLKKQVG